MGQSDEEFSKDMAAHGVQYSFNVYDNGINIVANALNSDIDFGLGKIVNTLKNPKFTQQDFEKAKKLLLSLFLLFMHAFASVCMHSYASESFSFAHRILALSLFFLHFSS